MAELLNKYLLRFYIPSTMLGTAKEKKKKKARHDLNPEEFYYIFGSSKFSFMN